MKEFYDKTGGGGNTDKWRKILNELKHICMSQLYSTRKMAVISEGILQDPAFYGLASREWNPNFTFCVSGSIYSRNFLAMHTDKYTIFVKIISQYLYLFLNALAGLVLCHIQLTPYLSNSMQ